MTERERERGAAISPYGSQCMEFAVFLAVVGGLVRGLACPRRRGFWVRVVIPPGLGGGGKKKRK